jgi:AraC family transcriptional regulator of adaptative response/methylated-DNA-[protein]-cysteine methyltransferase
MTSRIRWSAVASPLGWLLVAATERGVCNVRLGPDPDGLESELRAEFPFAVLERDDAGLAAWGAALARAAAGRDPGLDLPLDVPASRFRRRVWDALRRIPHGETRTYAEVAAALGRPRAARAVGGACAANPVALLVPCHRVVPAAGGVGGYRWGAERKRALLLAEGRTGATRRDSCSAAAPPR